MISLPLTPPRLCLTSVLVGLYGGIKFFIIDFLFKSCPKLRDKYDTPYIVWHSLPTDPQLKERSNATVSRRVRTHKNSNMRRKLRLKKMLLAIQTRVFPPRVPAVTSASFLRHDADITQMVHSITVMQKIISVGKFLLSRLGFAWFSDTIFKRRLRSEWVKNIPDLQVMLNLSCWQDSSP